MTSLATLAGVLLLAAAPSRAQSPNCSFDAPWDDLRTRTAANPEYVPIAEIDHGELLKAANTWMAAWDQNDVTALKKLLIPLPSAYAKLTATCIKRELQDKSNYSARPIAAYVDPSNPYYVRVDCEVALRLAGRCEVTMMSIGSWIKLDQGWRRFPTCGPEIVL
jgi:hypothetical protein